MQAAGIAPGPATLPTQPPAPATAVALPPEQAVCADLMRSALAEVQRFHPAHCRIWETARSI